MLFPVPHRTPPPRAGHGKPSSLRNGALVELRPAPNGAPPPSPQAILRQSRTPATSHQPYDSNVAAYFAVIIPIKGALAHTRTAKIPILCRGPPSDDAIPVHAPCLKRLSKSVHASIAAAPCHRAATSQSRGAGNPFHRRAQSIQHPTRHLHADSNAGLAPRAVTAQSPYRIPGSLQRHHEHMRPAKPISPQGCLSPLRIHNLAALADRAQRIPPTHVRDRQPSHMPHTPHVGLRGPALAKLGSSDHFSSNSVLRFAARCL